MTLGPATIQVHEQLFRPLASIPPKMDIGCNIVLVFQCYKSGRKSR